MSYNSLTRYLCTQALYSSYNFGVSSHITRYNPSGQAVFFYRQTKSGVKKKPPPSSALPQVKNFKFCTRIGLPIVYFLSKFRFRKSAQPELTLKCQNVENWSYWPQKVYVTPSCMAFRVWVTMTFPSVYELKKGWATRCT